MFVSCDQKSIVRATSTHPFKLDQFNTCEMANAKLGLPLQSHKTYKDLRIAIVVNWGDACGIASYTQYLVEALRPQVKEIRIFSEENESNNVVKCWKRGEPLIEASKQILAWKPDYIIIQHEFGIFPNACHFLTLLQSINHIPYVVTLHSVYEHLDKTICSGATRNIIVHSKQAKEILEKGGHQQPIFVIPHGCLQYDAKELWNIFQTPYTVFQFGFGFYYKGVDRAIQAIALLKSDPKFKNIFYCYLCAENPHNTSTHNQYCDHLIEMAQSLGIEENVAIIRGYQSEAIINNYLRTTKMAIFPYVINSDNIVFGASGAIRIAMANRVPVLASESHLFDDLEDVVPRPKNAEELAKEIDEVFSNRTYRDSIVDKIDKHCASHTWTDSAKEYLKIYDQICQA